MWRDDYCVTHSYMGFGWTYPEAWLDYLRMRAIRMQS